MIPAILSWFYGRASAAIVHLPDPVALVLAWLAVPLRLYAAGATGILFGWLSLHNLGILGNDGFIPYGYDKLFGGNAVYGMDAAFFEAIGVPLPGVTQVLIGLLELVGGIGLLIGLLTRFWALLLAGNMLVATLTAGNTVAEVPLLICCLLLVFIGGGMLSVDQLLDRRTTAAPAIGVPAQAPIPRR